VIISNIPDDKTQRNSKNNFAKWLSQRISTINYGIDKVSQASNYQLRCWLEGLPQSHPEKIAQKTIISHLEDEPKYYFCPSGLTESGQTLAKVDIDCHDGIGSSLGAAAAANHVTQVIGKLFTEPSKTAGGLHQTFIVTLPTDRNGWKVARELNEALDHFQTCLEPLATLYDISGIEVIGRAPTRKWSRHDRKLVDVSGGALALIPMTANPDIYNTTVLTIEQIMSLKPFDEYGIKVEADKPNANGRKATVGVVPTKSQSSMPKAKMVESVRRMVRDRLSFNTASARLTMLNNATDRPTAKVNADDLVAMLLAINIIRRGQKPTDKGLPSTWIAKVWRSLYEAGIVSRSYNPTRAKIARNLLVDVGWVNMIDNTYYYYPELEDEDGNKVKKKGRCMQWEISAEALVLLSQYNDETKFIDKVNSNTTENTYRVGYSVILDPTNTTLTHGQRPHWVAEDVFWQLKATYVDDWLQSRFTIAA